MSASASSHDEPKRSGKRNDDDLRRDVLAYLQQHHTLSLATQGPGGVWASTVFYVHLASYLYFLSSPDTRHALNLSANPRAAGTIGDDASDWSAVRGIQLDGNVSRVVDDEERLRALRIFQLRYPFVETLWGDGRPPVLYRMSIDRMWFYDHEHAEHRSELPGAALQ